MHKLILFIVAIFAFKIANAESISVECTPTNGFGGYFLNGKLDGGLVKYYIHHYEFDLTKETVSFGNTIMPIDYTESRITFLWVINGLPNSKWIFDRVTGQYIVYQASGPTNAVLEAGVCEKLNVIKKF